MRPHHRRRPAAGAVAVLAPVLALAGLATAAGAAPAHRPPAHRAPAPGWKVTILAKDPVVSVDGNPFAVTSPDDITQLGKDLFVTWQNGVGPQGQAAPSGVTFSTITEYGPRGALIASWDLAGKCDGLTADPSAGDVIATVDEDANSSVYTITPSAVPAEQVVHYAYPSAVLPHGGGTDAISVYRGRILISASAPGTVTTTAARKPAVYQVTFVHRRGALTGRASLAPLFYDDSVATVANVAAPSESASSPNPPSYCPPAPATCDLPAAEGTPVTLALTDPDSNEVVPADASRFAGDFVLDSQGDQQLIFVAGAGTKDQKLADLYLSQSVDDTAYVASAHGTVYGTDAAHNDIFAVTGPLAVGEAIVAATPGDANSPGTGPDYPGRLDLRTGTVTAIPALEALQPGGLLFSAS